jgi:parallel beta-helix repeat protein
VSKWVAAGSTAAPTAARNPLTGWFHADGFGAKFDGTTDDTAAIQAAVNAAKAVKGVVWLPSGTAKVGFIDCTGSAGLTIRGNGAGVTELQPRTGATLQRIFGSTGAVSGLRFERFTIRGAADDTGTYPRRGRTYTGTQLNSGITFDGDLLPSGSVGVIRDIQVYDCEFIGTTGLPILLRGVRGSAVIDSCRFYNTLDVGWTYCERAVCTDNVSVKSADNGFSLSRGNQSVLCDGNVVNLCSYWGIWVAGFEQGQGVADAGPLNFTVTGNVVTKAGYGGIALTDAPKHGTVTGNTVNTAYRGPTDQPSDVRGVGIWVGGYPGSDPNNVQVFAENITVSSNTLVDCNRGGVLVTGANDVLVIGNLIINPGTQFLSDGTTAVGNTDLLHNFGISILSGPNTTVNRFVVRGNEIVDKRTTPYGNYSIYMSGAPQSVIQANTHSGFRQGSTVADDNATESNITGTKTFRSLAGFVAGARAGANAATGTVPGFDINGAAGSLRPFRILTAGIARWSLRGGTTAESGSNAGTDLELVAHDDDGTGSRVPLTVRRSDGRLSLGAPLRLMQYTTAGRPSASTAGVGAAIYDTSLSKPVYSDGANWRDAAGTVV